MDINVRRFGKPREMLGLLQTPPAGKPRRAAFLMCRPFGQEAVRTAPIFRAMSDRLAREGCTVLVFDHHGCGDSPGEIDTQTIADWTDDTLAAHAQLGADAAGLRTHWFGMGLGANLVARAALRAEPAPISVVLWEPVLDAPAYIDRLLAAHRADLSREMGRSWADLVRRGEPEPTAPGSLLGFTLGPRLHDELRQTSDLPLQAIAARGIRIVMAVPDNPPEVRAAYDIPGLSVQSVETTINWMSTEASGSAIVPQEIPRTLLATL